MSNQPLNIVIDEAEFRAVANLVRQYNPHAKEHTLDQMRKTVLYLIEGGNKYATGIARCASTGGFIVSVGYVRNNTAYYIVSFDAKLLCPDPYAHENFLGNVSLERFASGK